jgi:UDP-N-acetylglucosamine--N-acetylmuramyl-(pentapeptide) pyrophosphoryl-undecaprenol N-acetylglucosamine transferase
VSSSNSVEREKLGFDKNKPLLLVIGGSLGARTINNALAKNYTSILNRSISIYWQTGKNYKNEIPENKDLKISPFIQNMTEAYAAADIIISRAGALSISELQIVGKPVILIPSPNVTDDHQTKNALSLSNNEAAILVKDSEAINKINTVITELNNNKDLQKSLSNNIKQMAKPDASVRIVNVIEQIIL